MMMLKLSRRRIPSLALMTGFLTAKSFPVLASSGKSDWKDYDWKSVASDFSRNVIDQIKEMRGLGTLKRPVPFEQSDFYKQAAKVIETSEDWMDYRLKSDGIRFEHVECDWHGYMSSANLRFIFNIFITSSQSVKMEIFSGEADKLMNLTFKQDIKLT
jgi:hypothetical protein